MPKAYFKTNVTIYYLHGLFSHMYFFKCRFLEFILSKFNCYRSKFEIDKHYWVLLVDNIYKAVVLYTQG